MSFFKEGYLGKASWRREATGIALWITLNLADLAMTVATMVATDGRFVEGNPVAAWIGGNIAGLVGYKLALTFMAIVLLFRIRRLHLLKWLNIIMAAIVVWNLALLSTS